MQKLSRRLGHYVGEHKALALVKLLIEEGTLVPAGSYRQRYAKGRVSHRVALYRRGDTRLASSARRVVVSVRRQNAVKPWWRHPLFGFEGETCPTWLPKRLRRWKEPPDRRLKWLHEQALEQLSPTESIRDFFDGRGTSLVTRESATADTFSTGEGQGNRTRASASESV